MKRQPKLKRCKVCKTEFQPRAHFQVVCQPDCALRLVQKKQITREMSELRKAELEQRREHRARQQAIRPLKWYADKAREACHEYIRERDRNAPCISCGRYHEGQYQAGHYRPGGVNSALRFDDRNIHKQCVPCNCHLSGNLTKYRIGLIAKIGEAQVVELEQNNEVKRWTKDELIEVRRHYKAKLAEIKNGH